MPLDTIEPGAAPLGADLVPTREEDMVAQLPEALRTGHWYCDLHHAMFIILLNRAVRAARERRSRLTEHFVDTLTVYWLVHSLMEEEGMALQVGDGKTPVEEAEAHCRAHVGITKWWYAHVLAPFKAAPEDFAGLGEALRAFYDMVVAHIAEIDQGTYGAASPLSEDDRTLEVAHIALSGLPLSPLMPGCDDVLKALAPYMRQALSDRSMAPGAREPLRRLALAGHAEPLWRGGKGAFRDVFLKRYGTVTTGSRSAA